MLEWNWCIVAAVVLDPFPKVAVRNKILKRKRDHGVHNTAMGVRGPKSLSEHSVGVLAALALIPRGHPVELRWPVEP